MLSLLFIYFLGKPFYALAQKHKQNLWLYTILGVVSYYASMLIAGVILGVLNVLISLGLETMSETILGIFTIPFGLLGCWGFYKLLEYKWEKMVKVEIETIDQIGNNQSLED
jgi:hypothetical protein